MSTKIRIYFSAFIFCLMAMAAAAQTANVTEGCSPLSVDFTSESMASYYWDFGDGANSPDQNPGHLFINPGVYAVQLLTAQNGMKVGEITITVFPDPVIEIVAEPMGGCSPLEVKFTTNITIDPGISVLSYFWTFGDGGSSADASPSYTYNNSGTFTVALQIETSIPACNKTFISPTPITVDGAQTAFTFTPTSSCSAPATIQFNNTTPATPGNTYQWTFGNGNTSTQYNPGSVAYDQEGSYSVTLVVMSAAGCTSSFTQVISVGPPQFMLEVPDTLCINQREFFTSSSGTSNIQWNFGPNASPQSSNEARPLVEFNAGGPQTVTLTIYNDIACQSDTSFVVIIDNPSAAFSITPDVGCATDQELTFTAEEANLARYDWSFKMDGSNQEIFNFVCPVVDSFAQNIMSNEKYELNVTSSFGCRSSATRFYRNTKPNARFIPTPARGCAPLNVSFEDLSEGATSDIISWTWINGDGTQETNNTGEGYTHIYTTPGEYYVLLVVENADGCLDTSYGEFIYVGESLTSTVQIDNQVICVGDTVSISFDNLDPRIDAWHLESDNGRFNHCWSGPSASHGFFTEPGVFDINLSVDYNGCISEETINDQITVNGAVADLSYMITCETPFDVMLKNEIRGESTWTWTVGDSIIPMMPDSLVYTFEATGDYMVYLEASDPASGCSASVDSQMVHIREVKSHFELEEVLCDNIEYTLDASMSQDVDKDCFKGYLWILPNSRPRELDDDSIKNFFPTPGPTEVTLVTEDMNGCTDSLTLFGTVYTIDPNFEFDEGPHCLPVNLQFTDLTTGDTTITEWEWNFGPTTQNASNTFNPGDETVISLMVTDAVGCTDNVTKEINIYEPFSDIIMDPGNRICIGETINFTATDFTEQGSFLNFTWDFGVFGTSNEQSASVTFDQAGTFPVLLTFTEVGSGCIGQTSVIIQVGAIPEASFTTNVDGANAICTPQSIQFTNTSTVDGQADYIWNLGNGVFNTDENPAFTYGSKGTYEVNLNVTTEFGCTDDISRTFTLVGPEGQISADPSTICNGKEIVFTLANQVDVSTFEWDFQDGTKVKDVNPATHTYTGRPEGLITVSIALTSAEGCTDTAFTTIRIDDLDVNFVQQDSSQFCIGRVGLRNLSSPAATQFVWDFGNGTTSTDANPVVIYGDGQGTSATVTLTGTDPVSGCSGTVTKVVDISTASPIYEFVDAFSPENGDDINNFFNVAIQEGFEEFVTVTLLRVYDRWGELIYDNDNPAQGWDGTYKGQRAPIGVYGYRIEIEVAGCGPDQQTGSVTLLR